ncbi:MAG: hypothetical protein IH845_00285 [Nanoarchaeota archaeon]|nr:hypothetical protein [Nanoarchaeota archaeon]
MVTPWDQKILFIKESKKFYSKISYKGISLWPIMAPEVYVYYKSPEKVPWRKIAMILKCLFTKDKFNIKGKKGNILASYIMARKDHHNLVKKALEKFPKKDITMLDAYEYKKSNSPFKVSYKIPNIFLLYKIWKKFKKSNMKEVLEDKYFFFIARTYFRYKQIEQFQKIYEEYTPKAYISFCSQAFPEEAILTLICKNNNVPTFTLQHGFIIEYPRFHAASILQENIVSDYNLIWGEKTADVLKEYTNKKSILVAGNPKISSMEKKSKRISRSKKGVVFLPVIGPDSSSPKICNLINEFAHKNPKIKLEISLHPFDDPKNYEKLITSKNISFIKNGVSIKDILSSHDFMILHNSTVAIEALGHHKPIFRFKDDALVSLWKNNDTFGSSKELEMLIKNIENSKTHKRWIDLYEKEFKKNFFIPSRGTVPQNYYREVMNIISKNNL